MAERLQPPSDEFPEFAVVEESVVSSLINTELLDKKFERLIEIGRDEIMSGREPSAVYRRLAGSSEMLGRLVGPWDSRAKEHFDSQATGLKIAARLLDPEDEPPAPGD